jgi:uncharacterized membrane protein YoaK (UPF0700 family)
VVVPPVEPPSLLPSQKASNNDVIPKEHWSTNHKEDLVLEKPEENMMSPVAVVKSPPRNVKKELVNRRQTQFAISLAILSGMLDVLSFQKFGCFVHLTTGNTFKCFTAATEMQWKQASFLAAMIACYTVGSGGFRFIDNAFQKQRNPKHNRQRRRRRRTSITADHSEPLVVSTTSSLSLLSFLLLPLFGLSDILVSHVLPHWPSSIVAFCWALGSGMVNTAALHSMGVVTNAVTGHWSKIGIALADGIVSRKVDDADAGGDDRTPTNSNNHNHNNNNHSKAFTMSRNVIAATAISICVTNVFVKGVALSPRRGGILQLMQSNLPPSGLVIGLLYFCLFQWYGGEEGGGGAPTEK